MCVGVMKQNQLTENGRELGRYENTTICVGEQPAPKCQCPSGVHRKIKTATTNSLRMDQIQGATQLLHYYRAETITEHVLFPEAHSIRGFVAYDAQGDGK